MNTVLSLIFVPALALLVTTGITPLVRRAALGTGRVAGVREDRWHEKPTPSMGGVAIFAGFAVALAVGLILYPQAPDSFGTTEQAVAPWGRWQGLLMAAGLIFALGLLDDFVQLRPSTKFAGQMGAAALLVTSGIGVWLTGIYAVDVAISLFWFVGVTNAMNLLDNMDGLSAGVGVVAGAVLSTTFLLEGQTGLAMLSLGFSGALLGFLAHNYPPARIFMGDSGSLFIGLFLAGLALAPAPGLSRSLFGVMVVPALVLAVPILDTTFVTVGRLLEGRPVSQGGRDHTSHGLVSLGVSESRAVWALWSLAAAGGGVGLLFRTADRGLAALLGGVLLVVLVLVGIYLMNVRFRDREGESGQDVGEAGSAGVEGVSPRTSTAAAPGTAAATSGGAGLYARLIELHHRYPVAAFLMDALVVALAYWGAYLIRWTGDDLAAELPYFRFSLPILVAVKLGVFSWAGMYAPGWRHAGIEDVVRVLRSNLFASVAVAATLLLIDRVGLSRGVLIADFFLASGLTLTVRFFFQAMERATSHWSEAGTPVVVVGAAEDALMAIDEIRRTSRKHPLRPVAIADAAFGPPRGRLRGFPVFGGRAALAEAIQDSGAHSVVVVRRADDEDLPYTVRDYLDHMGALDVFVLEISLGRLEAKGASDA